MLSDSFDYSCSFSSEFNTKTTAITIVAAFHKYQCQNWGTLAIILQIQSWLLRSGKRRAWCRLQLYSTWYESFNAIGNLSNWYAALLHLASQHGCVATSRTVSHWWRCALRQSICDWWHFYLGHQEHCLCWLFGCLPSSRCLLSTHGRVTDRVLFTGTARIKISFIQ